MATARETCILLGSRAEDLVEDRWPWDLYRRPGAESTVQWSLPEAADNPLFGLPPVPAQDLPPSPFRYLSWFAREQAEIFFGRGYEIRDLYQRATDPDSDAYYPFLWTIWSRQIFGAGCRSASSIREKP